MSDFDDTDLGEPMPSPASYIEAARKFIARNLRECCAELIEWDETAILRDGKVREAAAIYRNVSTSSALSMVRSEVALQSMTYIRDRKTK